MLKPSLNTKNVHLRGVGKIKEDTRMRKFYIVGLVVVIALIVGIVYADQMTFSTYYPAPYGRYRQFSTTGLTTLATDEFGNEGPTALVGIGTTNPNKKLEVSIPHQWNVDDEIRIGSYFAGNFSGLGMNHRIDDDGTVSKHIVDYDVGTRYTDITLSNGNVGIGMIQPNL